jgi:hypothetical protein
MTCARSTMGARVLPAATHLPAVTTARNQETAFGKSAIVAAVSPNYLQARGRHGGRRHTMSIVKKFLPGIVVGLAVAAAASPSLAQRSEQRMDANRERVMHECSVEASTDTQRRYFGRVDDD